MALELREASPDELPEVAQVTVIAFDADRSPDGLLAQGVYELFTPLVCREDGRLVACLSVGAMAAFYEGAAVPLGAVSMVSCLPEERRRGLVGRLLGYSLRHMRERGLCLSGLFTPHPSLYRRYGWAVAHPYLLCSVDPKTVDVRWLPRPQGRPRRVDVESWPLLDGLHLEWAARRNGPLVRSEGWWRRAVFAGLYWPRRLPRDCVLWQRPDGSYGGFMVYEAGVRRGSRDQENYCSVFQLAALDGDAYAGLLRYALSFDLAREVTLVLELQDPLPAVLDEAQRLQASRQLGMMLRLVDVAEALSRRPTAAPDGTRLLLGVQDEHAPWNQGVWLLEAEGGRLRVRPSQQTPQLSAEVGNLAPIYSGLVSPREAARTGLLQVHDPAGLEAAQRLLGATMPVSCPESF
ncbi:MAG TPA: GNAT family N-acetyltransferase [Dehalococcoidia bacterium]|nr:GNAT family N-acetyltransferase [Dehalococcoidia bacterium]